MLPNGKILVASATTSAELYDPSTASWSPTGPLASAHIGGMVLLATGKALIFGPQAAELYDPASNTWTVTGVYQQPHWCADYFIARRARR